MVLDLSVSVPFSLCFEEEEEGEIVSNNENNLVVPIILQCEYLRGSFGYSTKYILYISRLNIYGE